MAKPDPAQSTPDSRLVFLPSQQQMRSDLRQWGSSLDTLRWPDGEIIAAWLRAHLEREDSSDA